LAMGDRVERKLAAILAADVVGYSRLVGADEAGTVARLKALRKELIEPLVAEHRGRIVKLMGDGALVEFPSAVDAVECAVAIQKGVSEREAIKPEDRRIAFSHRHQHRRHHHRGRRHPGRWCERRRAPGGVG
jgi:adenylate cyclase